MKKIFALLAVVLGVVSCQTEPEGLDVNVGGEQEVAVCVSLPEATRASDSAEGAFKNLVNSDGYTIRYIFQVFYKNDESKAARQVIYSDGNTVSFPVRLVPGRDYNFVAWADVVPQAGKTLDVLGEYKKESDYRYNTENLKAVTFKGGEWKAMDETFDAYTDAETITYYGTTSINLHLTRPFAKLRVMTTDMVELRNLQIVPEGVTVEYTVPVYKSFDVTAQAANTAGASTHTFSYNLSEVEEYTATETTSTLFTNYLFGAENGIVKFTMNVNDNTTAKELIKFNNFNTDIPVQRNYLTTISGNILTDGNNVTVDIWEDGKFEGNKNWPDTNAEQLAYAAMFGGEVTLTENITLKQPLTIVEGANVVINLGGKTITTTEEQTGRHHYAILNNGTLSLEGEGTIEARGVKNFGTMTVDGDLTIKNVDSNGGAAIWNEGNLTINGGTFISSEGATTGSYGAALNTRVGGKAVVNNGTFKSYSYLTYAVINEGETTIYNANVEGKHGAVAGTETNDKTAIYGGTFKLNGIAGQSDHCTYFVSAIYGGTFSIIPDTTAGDSVFYSSTIADGYKAVEVDGKYVVVADEVDSVVADPADVMAAIKGDSNKNATVYVMPKEDGTDIMLEGKLSMAEGVKLIGMGDTPVALFNDWGSNAFANQAHFTDTYIENINFTNNLVIDAGIANGDVKFVGCVFGGDRAHQGVHFDSGNGTITFENCTFVGRNMFGASIEKVVFNNCTFLNKKSSLTGADKWTGVNMWGKYEFNNCTFDTEAHCNVKCDGVEAAFNNCKYVDNRDITTIINNGANYSATITF